MPKIQVIQDNTGDLCCNTGLCQPPIICSHQMSCSFMSLVMSSSQIYQKWLHHHCWTLDVLVLFTHTDCDDHCWLMLWGTKISLFLFWSLQPELAFLSPVISTFSILVFCLFDLNFLPCLVEAKSFQYSWCLHIVWEHQKHISTDVQVIDNVLAFS